ncbi:Oxidoreductase calI like protein [Verticillium longisporum]|nr:Oxidoreductase calI like protein [Verticillium longisporum]
MSRYAASHVSTQGPGDARPTALQVVEDEGLVNQLAGKVVLVTGANSGIGVETARAIHATGATLYITARDSAKAQQAIENIKNGPGPKSDAPIHAIELRLDSFASVRAAAKAFHDKGDKLNLLILNAGVMATPEWKTEDGFEAQFGTNHLGHFLLFQLLKPDLLAASTPDFQSRVVSVASSAHRYSKVRLDDLNFEKDPYEPWTAYGQSKTANIYFANEVERRYGSKGLHASLCTRVSSRPTYLNISARRS